MIGKHTGTSTNGNRYEDRHYTVLGVHSKLQQHFLSSSVAATVRDIYSRGHEKDYVMHAMAAIRTWLALNTNGEWEERRLFPKLQELIRKYRISLNCAVVFDADVRYSIDPSECPALIQCTALYHSVIYSTEVYKINAVYSFYCDAPISVGHIVE